MILKLADMFVVCSSVSPAEIEQRRGFLHFRIWSYNFRGRTVLAYHSGKSGDVPHPRADGAFVGFDWCLGKNPPRGGSKHGKVPEPLDHQATE